MSQSRRAPRPEPVDVEIPDDMKALWEERVGPIVFFPNAILRQTAAPVGRPDREVRDLISRMKEAMAGANGVGLAAPQLGVLLRAIVYRLPEEDAPVRSLVNPRIVSMKGSQLGPEGCLSIPLLQGEVERAEEIEVKGLDLSGRPVKRRASGFEARVIQHEVDHLDGILFIDRADLETLHWRMPGDDDEEEDVPAE
jgi:peptide deformylase